MNVGIALTITFFISYLLIANSKGTKESFFSLPFLVTTPPLIGLIYYNIISKFNLRIGEGKFIDSIFNEISTLYITSILSFSILYYFITLFIPPLTKSKSINIPNIKTSLSVYLIFGTLELLINFINPSVHLKILFGELSNLSFILLITSIIVFFRINKSILKFILIVLLSVFLFFIFTFDKGAIIALFASIFLILNGSQKLNIKINAVKINILIILTSFLLPFLNFIENYFFSRFNEGAFQSLTEAMESTIIVNYYHIFENENCNYNQVISIFDVLSSPFRALLGDKILFHQNGFMENCFPVERANGAGRAFGLISESAISNELPTFLYFSLAAIIFILIFEYFYYRFSLMGLIVYSQSIEIVYKLTRSETSSALFAMLYTIIASYVIYKCILIINPKFKPYKH